MFLLCLKHYIGEQCVLWSYGVLGQINRWSTSLHTSPCFSGVLELNHCELVVWWDSWLCFSFHRGHKETVVVLLQQGANTSAKNNKGRAVSWSSSWTMVDELLECCTDNNSSRLSSEDFAAMMTSATAKAWCWKWMLVCHLWVALAPLFNL